MSRVSTDAFARLRVFGGWEAFRSNLDPTTAPPHMRTTPASVGSRGYAGIRTPVGAGSSVAFRIETGDRRSRRVDAGWTSATDTGVMTAEWQTSVRAVSALTRYSRRENVESANLAGSYTIDDASGHLFLTVKRSSQLFGNIVATRTQSRDGEEARSCRLAAADRRKCDTEACGSGARGWSAGTPTC